jgi:hypothetical protein
MWDVNGLNGKPALKCTPHEIAKECWTQMSMDPKLNLPTWKEINSEPEITSGTGTNLEWNMWDSFKWDETKNELTTYEPKWSNSVNTLNLRPKIKDDILDNLYNATAYSLNKEIMFNMEGAAQSGVHAANLIQYKFFCKPLPSQDYQPLWLRIIRSIDNFLFCHSNKN